MQTTFETPWPASTATERVDGELRRVPDPDQERRGDPGRAARGPLGLGRRMVVARALAAVLGAVLVVFAGWSVIGAVVVPRRVRSPLTRLVALSVRRGFQAVG